MAKFNEYPAKTTPKDADKFMLYSVEDTANKLIDYDKLADAVLNKLTSKQFTLDQGAKTLLAAINELNSNSLPRIKADSYSEKDFNNILSSGWYNYSSTPTSAGLSNCPGISTGSLCVIILSFLHIQIWVDVDNKLYFRTKFYSSQWNTWTQIK